jgi:hypothetical protein
MQIEEITADLMRILELKLLEHVPTGEFNKDNLTYDIMNNLLDNLFTKSIHELNQSGQINVLASKEVVRVSLEKAGQFMCDEPKLISKAFQGYLKQHQSEEVYDEALKMSEYLIGALPLLIEEYINTNEFFVPAH